MNNNMTNKNSQYETSKQQNHRRSRRRKSNTNRGEQLLFSFVLLMGMIVLFNIYHIFKTEDYGHIHQPYHPLAAININKEKQQLAANNKVVVPQLTIVDVAKEEEEEEEEADEEELTSQVPTKENDSTNNPPNNDGSTKENESTNNPSDEPQKDHNDEKKDEIEIEIDEHLLRILRHVGINKASDLSSNDEDKKNLPKWEEVIKMYGNDGPVILGLDRCNEYNTQIVPNENERHIGIAGPFSSGTHYLSDILSKNCEFPPDPEKKYKNKIGIADKQMHRKDGILWQVPWGKHQSPRYRTKHNTKLNDKISEAKAAAKNGNDKDKQNLQRAKDELEQAHQSILPPSLLEYNTNILPVVVVRDPWTWMQSMCKTRYAAHWYHIVPDHCPNFIPTQLEKDWFNKTEAEVQKHYRNEKQKIWMVDNVINKANYTIDKDIIPLYVNYNSENSKHDSLVHMWKDWYQDYYDATYPRLMIRLEDLVFYPHETIRQVCECVDGAKYVGDENLQLNLESAIHGSGQGVDNIHGTDRVGLLGAMAKHIKSNRTKGMTKDDYNFALQALTESDVMNYFRYKIPSYH